MDTFIPSPSIKTAHEKQASYIKEIDIHLLSLAASSGWQRSAVKSQGAGRGRLS